MRLALTVVEVERRVCISSSFPVTKESLDGELLPDACENSAQDAQACRVRAFERRRGVGICDFFAKVLDKALLLL